MDDEGPNHSYDVFPANHRFLEWRDPDSNRGLHDLSGPSWVVTPTAVRRRRPYLSHFADLEALRGPPAIGAGRRGVMVALWWVQRVRDRPTYPGAPTSLRGDESSVQALSRAAFAPWRSVPLRHRRASSRCRPSSVGTLLLSRADLKACSLLSGVISSSSGRRKSGATRSSRWTRPPSRQTWPRCPRSAAKDPCGRRSNAPIARAGGRPPRRSIHPAP